MLLRAQTPLIQSRLAAFPAVALLGPRQCGKTTLARQFADVYFDLEQQGEVTRLDAQWEQLLDGEGLIVLDEAQAAPEVFPRLRAAIDADRSRAGRFLLLGSVSPSLIRSISESLAGRLAVIELTPFLLSELPADRMDDLWLCGGYPDGGILNGSMFGPWQQAYIDLLTRRDLPDWGLPAPPATTERLIRMLASLQAQRFNASQLGTALGLDSKTVAGYCDYLEGAFLIRRLQPYYVNLSKRLVKSPKIYWRDSGLLHVLLGVANAEALFAQPWVGHGWEGFVIEQTLSTLAAQGGRAQGYFFATHEGHELDLVLDWGQQRWAIEVKLTSSPSRNMVKHLEKTAGMIDAARHILICRSSTEIESDRLLITDLPQWLDRLKRG